MEKMSLLGGVGTVLGTVPRLEREAWPMVKCYRQATMEHVPHPRINTEADLNYQ